MTDNKQLSLDLATTALIQRRADEIKLLVRKTTETIIEIGQKLQDVKNVLPHGEFTAWLQREFSWSDRTARNLMNVAKVFGKTETVSDLEGIPQKVLYMLSSPSCPVEVRKEAVNEAKQTGELTQERFQELRETIALRIDPEFSTLLPSLADREFRGLEKSILREGCRESLKVWGNIILDGHQRYKICQEHNIPFTYEQVPSVMDRYDAMIFIIDWQLCRKNLNEFGEMYLLGKLKEIESNPSTDRLKG